MFVVTVLLVAAWGLIYFGCKALYARQRRG